jgi:small-conductance mechanosensitive channel
MEQALQRLLERIVLLLPRAAISIVVAVAFWLAARVVGNIINGVGRRTGWAPDVINLASQTTKIVLIIFGIITAFGTVGINVSALVAGLGLTGFALGFALKDALSNVLAGALILSYRPFRRGERIEVSGYQGAVADVDFRYTTLETEDKTILLPNSNLFTNTVVVFHKPTPASDSPGNNAKHTQ